MTRSQRTIRRRPAAVRNAIRDLLLLRLPPSLHLSVPTCLCASPSWLCDYPSQLFRPGSIFQACLLLQLKSIITRPPADSYRASYAIHSRQFSCHGRTTTSAISFSAASPRVWNSLPPHLQRYKNFARFKRQLKTFLFGS